MEKPVLVTLNVTAAGRKGAAEMTAKQRSEAAKIASNARWAGHVAKRPTSSWKKAKAK